MRHAALHIDSVAQLETGKIELQPCRNDQGLLFCTLCMLDALSVLHDLEVEERIEPG